MKHIKKCWNTVKGFFTEIGMRSSFLTILAIMGLLVIAISVFDPNLDASGNLVTIRTVFSAIIGYILKKSTSSCSEDYKALRNKTWMVGVFAIIMMIIVVMSYILEISVNNPSLILIKNLLFSAVGFLTSSNEKNIK